MLCFFISFSNLLFGDGHSLYPYLRRFLTEVFSSFSHGNNRTTAVVCCPFSYLTWAPNLPHLRFRLTVNSFLRASHTAQTNLHHNTELHSDTDNKNDASLTWCQPAGMPAWQFSISTGNTVQDNNPNRLCQFIIMRHYLQQDMKTHRYAKQGNKMHLVIYKKFHSLVKSFFHFFVLVVSFFVLSCPCLVLVLSLSCPCLVLVLLIKNILVLALVIHNHWFDKNFDFYWCFISFWKLSQEYSHKLYSPLSNIISNCSLYLYFLY